MPKLIVTSRYLKSGSKKNLSNYVKYIASREGVVPANSKQNNASASKAQSDLIKQLLADFPDGKELFEYGDYIRSPTVSNASKLISEIIDRNMDRLTTREKYVGYLANRPGAVKFGEHGLFNGEDKPIDLEKTAKEIADHSGNVWTHVVSLRRDNAQAMGYDNISAWRELVKRQMPNIAKQSKIDMKDLRWYAAYHDKRTNPHVHIIVYSEDPRQGFLTGQGIEKIRSGFANDIYHDEMYNLYSEQTQMRNELKKGSAELMAKLTKDIADENSVSDDLKRSVLQLKGQLDNSKGKKVYRYLKPKVKETVDDIFFQLAQNETIRKMYSLWCEMEQAKHDVYSSAKVTFPPLENNQQFNSVKNMIIKTVLEMDTSFLTEKESSPPKPTESVSDDETMPIDYGDNLPTDDFTDAVEVDVSNDISRSEFTIKWSDDYKSACKKIYEKHSEAKDYIEAEKLLLSEKAKGNALVIYALGKLYSTDKLGAKDEERSFEYYKQALQGFMEIEPASGKLRSYVQYRIGKMHCYGLGTEKDYGQAFNWFERSAAMGNKFAQFSLANLYYYGSGVEQNYEKAYKWYMRSAQQGQPYAAYALAQMYANGEYVDKDELQAQLYYKQALAGFLKQETCGQADDNLFYKMGRMFRLGLGTDADIPKAIEYFGKAADLGNKNAKRAMALEYISGEHIRQDVDKGIEMLTELADGGDPMAAYRLGKLYLFGSNEVEKNKEKAVQWLTKSAEDGNEYATTLLQNADDHDQEMLVSAVLGLFVSLSRVIADDYDRQKDYMSRHADSRLLRSINKLRWQLGEMRHNDGNNIT